MGSEVQVEVGPGRIESEESAKSRKFSVIFTKTPPLPCSDLIDRPPRSTSNFRVRVRVRVRVSVRVDVSHWSMSDTESAGKGSSKFRH